MHRIKVATLLIIFIGVVTAFPKKKSCSDILDNSHLRTKTAQYCAENWKLGLFTWDHDNQKCVSTGYDGCGDLLDKVTTSKQCTEISAKICAEAMIADYLNFHKSVMDARARLFDFFKSIVNTTEEVSHWIGDKLDKGKKITHYLVGQVESWVNDTINKAL